MARRIFTHQPVAMARIPLRPATSLSSENSSAGLLSEGVFLASRSASQAAASSRLAATLRAYDIRSRTRTTPHGVFSGVAPAPFTNQPATLRMGTGHEALTVPSPRWLIAVTERLLGDPSVLARLTLSTNNLTIQRGERLEVEHPAPGGTTHLSSVRSTPVTRWLLDTCQDGANATTVLAALLQRHPAATRAAAQSALQGMITSGLLLTDLLPADPRRDPLGHLLHTLPPSTAIRPDLVQLRNVLTHADKHPPGTPDRLGLLRTAHQLADEILAVERPLTVDTLADATLILPATLGDEAAQAADVLWRVGHLTPPAAEYHARFLSAYGHHHMVPLLEAIDPVTGIGPPDPTDAIGARSGIEPRRAALLARLLAQATAHGATEIAIDDNLVNELSHDNDTPSPRTAEIHVRVIRHTDGALGVAVCPDAGSQDAGSAPGRWAHRLASLAPHEPPPADGNTPLIAEIICRPRTAATASLAVETGFAPYRIPLGVPERDGDLTPADLVLTTNGQHLIVWSERHNRRVIPVLYSRLAPDLLPPAASTLQLLGHAGTRPWHTWSWGPAGYAPFTPRVRYRNTVLAPARWTLPGDLTSSVSDRRTWDKALTAWRTSTTPAPPHTVVVQESDRQLPLDLRDEDQRELLRRSVHRGARAVTEPLGGPGTDDAVLPGPAGVRHILDLVVPLTRRTEPAPSRLDPRTAPRAHGTGRHLPGSNWLSVALSVPVRHQNTALQQLAVALRAANSHIDRWFWLRYESPALGPHLRIRFHGHPTELATHIQSRLTAWATHLEEQKLSRNLLIEPYVQETERYGGPHAITAAEEVFAADSTLALQALTHTTTDDDRLVLAAASALDIARTLTDGPSTRDALRPGPLTTEARRQRNALRPQLRTAPLVPPPLTTTWSARQQALTTYADTLASPQASALYASDLIHMHCNRLLGPLVDRERTARSLATDLLHIHDHQH